MPVPRRQRRHNPPAVPFFEALEERHLLSSIPLLTSPRSLTPTVYIPIPITVKITPPKKAAFSPIAILRKNTKNLPASSSGPVGFLPIDLRTAYGINQILFGNTTGDGSGQTIAIIDAYDLPTAYNDLSAFSSATNLPSLQLYTGTNTAPYFRQVAQDGSANYPTTDPAGPGASSNWEEEEALDIEWAHAIAPAANILLVEAKNPDTLFTAVGWARTQPGVSVISMSFSGSEDSGETFEDSLFTTPSGHTGITYLAATGDTGAPGGYPAYSPNVVAVGGTSLFVNSDHGYNFENGWNGSGGGISTVESKPVYQTAVTQSASKRTIPDIAMDADPNTGAAVYDTYDFGVNNPWFTVGGTSLATPMFAGLIAITNQGRALAGLSSLDGPSQTLPALYALPSADFHDVTNGNNGFTGGNGYDLVTGLGSPVAQLLVPALAAVGAVSGTVYQDNNGDGSLNAGDTPLSGVTVFIDSNGNGVLDRNANTTSLASTNVPLAIPDNRSTGATSTLAVSGLSTITNLTITFSINHSFDGDLTGTLTAPNGSHITLFSHVGGSNDNFTNTTLSSSGSISIAGGTAPFSGTFSPSPGSLSTFSGANPNGTWKFKVVDNSAGGTGSIISWSLAITSGVNETSTITDANGNYSFILPNAFYNISEITPPTYFPTSSTSSTVTVASNNNILNFGNFPTIFNASGANDSFFLTLNPNDNSKLQIYNGASATGTPAYTIPTSFFSNLAATLTFNLQGANSILAVDYSNGSPIPGPSITVNGIYDTNQELRIFGGNPNNPFTMTDSQISLNGSSPILFNTLPTMTLYNGTFNFSGSLNTLQNLNINSGSTFIWS